MPSFNYEMPCNFDALPAAAEKLAEFVETNGAPPDAAYAASLAFEEMTTNTIKYGHSDPGNHTILLSVELSDSSMRMVLTDEGKPFDPFTLPEPDLTVAVEDRQIGGLGIHFVRKMLDECLYERRSGKNIVTLVKNFNT